MEWVALYKFGRLAFLAFALVGIAIWLFRPSQRDRFEAPARRMLEEGGSPMTAEGRSPMLGEDAG
ncbi:MAG: cbb3-type cytochrome c oxidase subunit 3 [Myxococcota bacterium]